MSYLLDALKQSQQHDEAAAHDRTAEQEKQQKELQRYRFIAISLGLLVGFILTLMAGFSIGKWLQNSQGDALVASDKIIAVGLEEEKKNDAVPQVTNQVPVNNTTAQPTVSAVVPQIVAQPQPQIVQPINQQIPQQNSGQYQWVQVPVNTVPTYSQSQPMLVQTPNGYQQVYTAPPQQQYNPNVMQVQQVQQASNTSASSIDMSKYKVLGKPLGEQAPAKPKPVATVTEEELEIVPTALKNAFARAIEDTQNTQTHQITQGTKNSSYAEPIELLPDALLALIPQIKYQAHIYSSSPDKRWVKLNNRELYEGDRMGDFRILEITPEQTVLSFDDYEFSLKALQDWPQ